jgi:GAF domain-containing protein
MMNDNHGPDSHGLITLIFSTRTLDDFLRALAHRAMAHTSGCDGCGVTLERSGQPLTVASTGEVATRLDEQQYGQDGGPCLEALHTGRTIIVPEMRDEDRWGGYGGFAAAHGARSSLSLPIAAKADTAGALNLYSSHSDAFAGADLPFLRSLAAEATGAVALAQEMADLRASAPRMRTRLHSRTIIDQAVGVVMAERGYSPPRALDMLREAARERRVGLPDVSAELLDRYGGAPGEGGSPVTP